MASSETLPSLPSGAACSTAISLRRHRRRGGRRRRRRRVGRRTAVGGVAGHPTSCACGARPVCCAAGRHHLPPTPLLLITTHYSLLTKAVLTTHYALLTPHYALFTTHYSPLTTHCSLGVLRGWLYKTSSSRGPLRRAPSRATHRRFFVLRHRRLQIFASQARCLPPLALAGPPRASHLAVCLADCLARRFAPAPCMASHMAPCLVHCMTQGLVSPGTCPPSRLRSLSPLLIPPRRTAPT